MPSFSRLGEESLTLDWQPCNVRIRVTASNVVFSRLDILIKFGSSLLAYYKSSSLISRTILRTSSKTRTAYPP